MKLRVHGLKYIDPITGKYDLKKYKKDYKLKNKKYIKEYSKHYMKKYILENKEYIKEYKKKYYLKNKEKVDEKNKEFRLKNPKYIEEYNKKYYILYKEKLKENARKYRLKNLEYITEYKKNYSQKNKEYLNEYHKKYQSKRKKIDINYKLKSILRSRIYKALKKEHKSDTTVKLLGCSIYDFKKHIESLFQPWMSWENYGKWHIDHIKPCALFDLTLPERQQECFHWSNMRPLEAIENLKKGAKYE